MRKGVGSWNVLTTFLVGGTKSGDWKGARFDMGENLNYV
jgi:hypothetical protein